MVITGGCDRRHPKTYTFPLVLMHPRKSEIPYRKSTVPLECQNRWIFQVVRKSSIGFSGASMDFLENPQRQFGCLWIFQNIQMGNVLHLGFSRKSMDFLESPRCLYGFSRSSMDFLQNPQIFQIIHAFSRTSMDFLEHPWIFQKIHRFSRSSMDFLEHPQIFQIIHGFSRKSTEAMQLSLDILEYPEGQCIAPWIFQKIHGIPR